MANNHEIAIVQRQQHAAFICSACGADRHCQCDAPAITKSERARLAIVAHPDKSDRAIAAEIGTSNVTVSKVRKTTVNQLTVDHPRTGRDGKTRRMPVREDAEEERHDEEEVDDKPDPTMFHLVVEGALELVEIRKPLFDGLIRGHLVDADMVASARHVAEVWNEIAKQLEDAL